MAQTSLAPQDRLEDAFSDSSEISTVAGGNDDKI